MVIWDSNKSPNAFRAVFSGEASRSVISTSIVQSLGLQLFSLPSLITQGHFFIPLVGQVKADYFTQIRIKITFPTLEARQHAFESDLNILVCVLDGLDILLGQPVIRKIENCLGINVLADLPSNLFGAQPQIQHPGFVDAVPSWTSASPAPSVGSAAGSGDGVDETSTPHSGSIDAEDPSWPFGDQPQQSIPSLFSHQPEIDGLAETLITKFHQHSASASLADGESGQNSNFEREFRKQL